MANINKVSSTQGLDEYTKARHNFIQNRYNLQYFGFFYPFWKIGWLHKYSYLRIVEISSSHLESLIKSFYLQGIQKVNDFQNRVVNLLQIMCFSDLCFQYN